MNHIDEPASFHLTSTAACNPSGSATEAGSACMVMPGHCLTVSCAPYLMATPLAVKIDIDHPTYRAHLSGILSIVDTPPPRA